MIQKPEKYWIYTRDWERTPMQWTAKTTTAGFTNGKPWLPINDNYIELNVEVISRSRKAFINEFFSLI
jgi:glycosidase